MRAALTRRSCTFHDLNAFSDCRLRFQYVEAPLVTVKFNAELVKAYQRRENKSREVLATQWGVSYSKVVRILSGKVPDAETLTKIADSLGCHVEDLIIKKADGIRGKKLH